MSTDRSESVWFHLYDDREKAAALELHASLLMEFQELLASDKRIRAEIAPDCLAAIEGGRIAECTTATLALLAHDLGYRIEIKLSPRSDRQL
ncbi:hypothetical protein [Lysobacter soli]|uniref:hypothetical protein n=1 Tax=Lysobacter soli TaxID=453783 RepID=UPI00240FCC2C|nr:hypothetical protein [Lysobacter soli]